MARSTARRWTDKEEKLFWDMLARLLGERRAQGLQPVTEIPWAQVTEQFNNILGQANFEHTRTRNALCKFVSFAPFTQCFKLFPSSLTRFVQGVIGMRTSTQVKCLHSPRHTWTSTRRRLLLMVERCQSPDTQTRLFSVVVLERRVSVCPISPLCTVVSLQHTAVANVCRGRPNRIGRCL